MGWWLFAACYVYYTFVKPSLDAAYPKNKPHKREKSVSRKAK